MYVLEHPLHLRYVGDLSSVLRPVNPAGRDEGKEGFEMEKAHV
jgi:hypothetical protein